MDSVCLGLTIGIMEPYVQREAWRHYGRRVFVLDPATFALLARTDLPRLPAEVLTFPLHAFYVVFPQGWYVHEDGWDDLPLEGALVTVDRTDGTPGYERWLRITVFARADRRTTAARREARSAQHPARGAARGDRRTLARDVHRPVPELDDDPPRPQATHPVPARPSEEDRVWIGPAHHAGRREEGHPEPADQVRSTPGASELGQEGVGEERADT